MNTELKPIEGVYNCHYDDLSDASLLLDHPKNPHIHPDRQIDALSHVIDLVGWRHPVVVSKDSGCIVYGHGRKLVAIKRGELVPVEYQSFGSEAEELAALMADNLIPELAEYSEELKLSNLEELKELDFDFEPLEELESENNEKKGKELKENLIVEVQCSSEYEQSEVYNMLTNEGYTCRVLGI